MVWNFNKYILNQAAVSDHGESITYEQLALSAEEFAQNIPQRSLIFALCKNSIGSLVGYAGMINYSNVSLLLNSATDRELLRNLINVYRPDYLWVPKSLTTQFEEFSSIYDSWDYVLLKTTFDWHYPLSDDLALLLTTSGSTGSPKLVRLTSGNLKANTQSIVEYLQLDSTEKPITTLPMNYSYGMSIINSHLAVGATLLLTDSSIMEKKFWSFFREREATSFGGVPYTYEMLNKLRFFRMNLDSLRTLTQAGGKIPVVLHQKFAEYAHTAGKRFFVMYGQTEASPRMAYLPHEKALEKCGSIGIAIPGGKFSLVGTDGKEINEPYVPGELVYSGANVSLGYAEAGEDLNKGDEFKGRLYTGDLAQFDKDGYFYIVGRKKRFLKIFGNRLNLEETEGLIQSHFNTECACTGVDDKMRVFVTGNFPTEEIKKFISEKTALNPVAFDICSVDAIPKNEYGKVLYQALEENGSKQVIAGSRYA